MSRRVWRWAVLVWVVTVAVGGALTVWLQDSAEPPRTPASHGTDDSGPAPVVGRNGDDLKDLAGMCSATPGASPTPAEASGVIVVCLRETPRP
ncbi:hypothetical protein ACKI1I_22625 [Streptomyces turgidiscabies]|uniref:hypothetical protein n=1 Tax=Streptomyces TaxID=1883 RepID=UPI00076E8780|nr:MULTISPECIES: hypothetical protein [Streptomyces]MDX3495477.1 hypothetical protein [Streptomyces turgidiscabies]GAQ70164.1 hypothetical protein T45_01898 [Streptomyces turgidiscabies]